MNQSLTKFTFWTKEQTTIEWKIFCMIKSLVSDCHKWDSVSRWWSVYTRTYMKHIYPLKYWLIHAKYHETPYKMKSVKTFLQKQAKGDGCMKAEKIATFFHLSMNTDPFLMKYHYSTWWRYIWINSSQQTQTKIRLRLF